MREKKPKNKISQLIPIRNGITEEINDWKRHDFLNVYEPA